MGEKDVKARRVRMMGCVSRFGPPARNKYTWAVVQTVRNGSKQRYLPRHVRGCWMEMEIMQCVMDFGLVQDL